MMNPLSADRQRSSEKPTTGVAAWRPALISIGLVGIVLAIDLGVGDRGILYERPPEWDTWSVVRAALLALSSASMIRSARHLVAPGPSDRTQHSGGRSDITASVIGFGIPLLAAVLVVVDPDLLTRLASEDGLVEWASAVVVFAAAALFAAGIVLVRRHEAGRARRHRLIVLSALFGFCFLVGMEEVSWFQRVLDLDSPDLVRNRNQPEFNLHNEATDLSENLYYGVSFVILVLLPGVLRNRRPPPVLSDLEPVLPTRTVLYGTVAAGAVVYEMWEIIPMQMIFFMSLVLLLVGEEPAPGRGARQRPLDVVAVVVMVVVVIVFLGFGHRMTRSWDDTEVRELMLPVGFLLYGFEATRRLSSRSSSR